MTIATQPAVLSTATRFDDDHEQIVIRQEPETGLRFIVAVHSTVLGPALGGMRLKGYPGGLREALEDVMGLARTMTLKASAAGLDLGGGKSVMIDDGRPDERKARLEVAAEVIDGLDGAYITAEDIGTTTADMDHLARFTRFSPEAAVFRLRHWARRRVGALRRQIMPRRVWMEMPPDVAGALAAPPGFGAEAARGRPN